MEVQRPGRVGILAMGRLVNNERLLEPLGYITPIDAEEKYEQALKSDIIAA